MATVLSFPVERSSIKAYIEALIDVLPKDSYGFSYDEKEELSQIILDAHRQYSQWGGLQAVVTPPVDQPFTDDQITSIHNAQRDMEARTAKHFDSMFSNIIMLIVEVYKIGTSCSTKLMIERNEGVSV